MLVSFPYTNNSLCYPAPVFKIYVQKYCWYHFHIPIIAYAVQRPSSKSVSKSIVGINPILIPIITYSTQRPSSKFVPKSIIGTIPNTNKNLRYPAPVFKTYPQKYCWCHSHIPMIAYAIQRPSSQFIPTSIIGPIPNTSKNLRYPAPVFTTYPQSIVGTIPNTNSNLRCKALVKYHTNFPNCILSTIPNT